VYSYVGKIRGPIPYGVLLIDIIFPLIPVERLPGQQPIGNIIAQVRPNITVSLVSSKVQDVITTPINKYEYKNHYDNTKKIVTIIGNPSDGGLPLGLYDYRNNNSLQETGAIETKTLYSITY
jgi:hypothetical protein